MIAATAIAEDLPLFTTNPDDYAGLERLVRVIPVTRPPAAREEAVTSARSDGSSPGKISRPHGRGQRPGLHPLAAVVAGGQFA